ncbi:MAG: NAD(P)H-dependent flavin oxidoreductase [Candidatus Omnitrophota bacterium]
MKYPLLKQFSKRGREFLGVEYPFICGAMAWVSTPELVAAVSNTGAFACLAAGNAPVEVFKEQIKETRRLTNKPFGANIITIAPRYREHLECIKDMKLPYVVFAGSIPRAREIKLAKESGTKVLAFASTLSIAHRMVEYGADALILEGHEAGGHVGHVSLTVLIQQVLFEVCDILPIFTAGGIAQGKMCAHMLLMGASGVQLGTRFAISKECCAHDKFKEAMIKANARDAVSTPQFDSRLPVVAVRALRNKGMDNFRKLQIDLIKKLDKGTITRINAQEQVEEFWLGALKQAVVNGDIEFGSIMSGQSVGLVDKIMSINEIITDLADNTEAELQSVKDSFK